MISVDEVNDGVFQVVFTDADLQTLSHAATRVVKSRDHVIRGLLMFVVGVYFKAMVLERSQDGLD